MLKPEYGKDKFEIVITVHENCQTFHTRSTNGEDITYQQVIGALDTAKMHYFFEQSGINIEEYRKWERKQNKKKENKSK